MSNKAYFEQVYETYASPIFRFILLRVGNDMVAEDITAETFMRFWQRIEEGKKIANERALLYVIARGMIIDYYRSAKHTKETTLDSLSPDVWVDDELFEKVYIKGEIERICKKLSSLKKEYEEIIILRFVEDLKIGEIAAVLDQKESNIRVLLHRAIQSLKKKL